MSVFKLLLVASISALAVAQIPTLPKEVLDVISAAGEFAKVAPGIVEQVCKVPTPADDILATSKTTLTTNVNKIVLTLQAAIPKILSFLKADPKTAQIAGQVEVELQKLNKALQDLVVNINAATSVSQLCTVIQNVVKEVTGQVTTAINAFIATLKPCYKDLVNSLMTVINVVVLLNTTNPSEDQLVSIKANISASIDPIVAGLMCIRRDLLEQIPLLAVSPVPTIFDRVINTLNTFKTTLNTITSIAGLNNALTSLITSFFAGIPTIG